MRWLDRLRMKMRMLLWRKTDGNRLNDELDFHLAKQVDENIAAGMNAEEARYAALRAFGNPALVRDQARAAWSWSWLESLANDVRYNLRTLRRAPGFTLMAVAVIALGIGSNVALFTIVRGVLLKPLSFKDPEQLVTLYEAQTQSKHHTAYLPVAFGSFSVWQSATQGVAQMAAVSPWQDANVSAENGKLPEKIRAALCSWNLFSILGVEPALGRVFTEQDDSADAPATVVLTHSFWAHRYSSDPAI